MSTLIVIVHVLVCVFLILVILLQAGKGGGMGGAFGGAGAQTVFGGRGAQTFLGKLTAGAAAVFMLTSVALAFQASRTKSEIDREAAAPAPFEAAPPGTPPGLGQEAAPVVPGPEAPARGGPTSAPPAPDAPPASK